LEWILGRLAGGGGGLDLTGTGLGLVASSCECSDEPSGSCATELVSQLVMVVLLDAYGQVDMKV
jgi:hypothetical protein